MSKNDLRKGMDAIIGDPRPISAVKDELSPEARERVERSLAKVAEKKRPGRPKKEVVEDDGYFRTTIIAHRENYEKLKVVSMKLGRSFKEVLNAALAAAVETYEEKNGEIILREKDNKNPFK